MAAARMSTIKFASTSVMKHVGEDYVACQAMTEYLRNFTNTSEPSTSFINETSVKAYQPLEDYDPEAKPGLVPFMAPVMAECYTPTLSRNNEVLGVEGRITKVVSLVEANKFLLDRMDEFINFFVPRFGGTPATQEQVYENQPRKSQRVIIARAENMEDASHAPFLPFPKIEAYSGMKDERLVTPIAASDKIAYSQFIYPLADLLKTVNWYAFSLNPLGVAHRVVEVVENATTACNTDLSRFDGHVSPALRTLEHKVLIRFYPTMYHDALLKLHASQFKHTAVTPHGVKYNTGFARASGSPETSCFNSIANAFMAYVALKQTRTAGAYPTAEEAYNGLGVYGGDDGLTADVDPKAYIRACESVGQKLEVEPVARGCSGITFLSRQFSPDVWFGALDSCCDLPRQLSKFHTTVRLPSNVTPEDKLIEKARSYILTDGNTPIIGDLCQRVMQFATHNPANLQNSGIGQWFSRYANDVQFPNENHNGWMDAYALDVLPGFDHAKFQLAIRNTGCLIDLLHLPECIEQKEPAPGPVTMVVNDTIVRAAARPAAILATPPPRSFRGRGRATPVRGRPTPRARGRGRG